MARTVTPSGATIVSADKYEQHPTALQMVPGTMSDEEFDALCEDLKRRGQQHDIILYEGKILDGMHRYRGCLKTGLTPRFKQYTGDDPVGLVIALNVLRRKLGSTQRALAGARLNIDFNVTQDEASKRVGVSKVHINLVVQALRSKSARLLKLLENPDLTRAALHEEMVDCGVITSAGPASPPPAATLSAAAVNSVFGLAGGGSEKEAMDDLLGDASGEDALDDDLLGAPPSAGGRVLDGNKAKRTDPDAPLPQVGTRPAHPERRSRDTPAQRLADAFKGMPEGDKVSFMQIVWPTMRPLLKLAGLSAESNATGGSAATIATDVIAKAKTTAASAPAAAPAPGKAGKAAPGKAGKAAPGKAGKAPAKAGKG